MSMRILAVGDVCGEPGLAFLENRLKDFKKENKIDFAVVNGENANVVGITPRQADAIFRFRVTMPGVPTHCSRPEDGVSAVYEMQEIISRVRRLSDDLLAQERKNGTIALSRIESSSASLNAVPYSCSIYLDRRTTIHMTPEMQFEEMDRLVAGTKATWEVLDIHHKTWKGYDAVMHSVLPAFELEENHVLVTAAKKAFRELFDGQEVENFRFKGTTNAVSSAGTHHIPTIVFGAGVENMCHAANEYCPLEHLGKACAFYVNLVANL